MKVKILDIRIDNLTFEEAVEKVEGFLKDGKKHQIVTPNPEIVVLSQKDKNLRQIINHADLAIPDGIGLLWASRLLAQKKIKNLTKPGSKGTQKSKIKITNQNSKILRERVTGVDLMEKICQLSAVKGFKVGLLGGRGDTASKTAKFLSHKFSKLNLRVFRGNEIDDNTDVLFVAFGAPKQEKWIAANLPKIPVKVAMGVGGAFEMLAGVQKRAPKLVQFLALEWLWRLILQPWRIKRQIKLLTFVYLVFRKALFN